MSAHIYSVVPGSKPVTVSTTGMVEPVSVSTTGMVEPVSVMPYGVRKSMAMMPTITTSTPIPTVARRAPVLYSP